jgi:hypothetical protein
LIAPIRVVLFDNEWRNLGTKGSLTLLIFEITGIGKEVLQDADKMHRLSVAQRMAWVSKRKTTRVEDIAYCLLGIFGVNMPMLYGEGEYAFIRLQEEIVKNTNDITRSSHGPATRISVTVFLHLNRLFSTALEASFNRKTSLLVLSS